jgi:hypothetical protein
MTASRLIGRRGDGSAVVRGWVAVYTLGLPAAMRARRRDEVAADLADETVDAVRRGERSGLRRRRLMRWVLGIPDDLAWRFMEAPAAARIIRAGQPPIAWVPVSRWSLALLAIVAIGAAGGLSIVAVPELTGQARADVWLGWGRYGFAVGCVAVLVAVLASIPWPGRGVAIVLPGVAVGFAAAPWLWGCWLLAVIGVGVRWYLADEGTSWPRPTGGAR